MKIKIQSVTVRRRAWNHPFPDVELPDDAVVLRADKVTDYALVVQFYVPTLRPNPAP